MFESFWKFFEKFWKLLKTLNNFLKTFYYFFENFLKLLKTFWKLYENFLKTFKKLLKTFWKLMKIIWNCPHLKVPYFFISAEKFVGHSFIRKPWISFFIFVAKLKKKKYNLFFFYFPGKVHTPFIQILVRFQLLYIKMDCIFFLPAFWCVFLFFFSFPGKVQMSFIHSFPELFFNFSAAGKEKKKQLFHSFNQFFPQMCHLWTFPGK